MPGEKVEKARFGIDGLETVHQQHRSTGASTHNLKLDTASREPLASRHHILPSGKLWSDV
jgi:hypothetical protein